SRANGFVPFWVLQKIDDLLQFEFGFFAPGHIGKSDTGFFVGYQPGAALANAKNRLARASPHPPGNKTPQNDHDDDWQDPRQHDLRNEAGPDAGEFNAGVLQLFDQFRIFNPHRAEEKWFVYRHLAPRGRSG